VQHAITGNEEPAKESLRSRGQQVAQQGPDYQSNLKVDFIKSLAITGNEA
jgi:hypothetical protein